MAGTGVETEQAGWSSRWAFILAAVGAAVGLGNIWRFPTLAGENGGGAFVLFYILCVIFLGLPLVLSEIVIGRHGRKDAAGSVAKVAQDSGVSTNWAILGGIGIIAAFCILSTYSIIAGWVIYYAGVMGADFFGALFSGDPFASALAGEAPEAIGGRMDSLFANVPLLIVMHTLFMGVTIWIVARGVLSGIEKAATYLMPAFFVLLITITAYGAFTGEFARAVSFLFTPDFSRLTPPIMNQALGQALFSMSLSSAALITYGAYVSRETRLPPVAGMIGLADTGVAIVAGLMIFPIVFAAGLDPAAGATLIFRSLPLAFNAMPAGALIGFLFFVLIFFAALTSSISLLEAVTAWAMRRFAWSRHRAALVAGGAIYAVGALCALSLNVLSDVRLLSFWPSFAEADIMNALDGVVGTILLPVAALLTAIFIGWKADRNLVVAETGLEGGLFALWRFLIAWLCPLAVTLILLFGLFPGLLGS
ncbi:sodium-dependent transporter [Parasphingopyxis lamellibrachiae]|uniref:NSS family neurotransmitter:Na+ symporter n=1 Tax=Parasphingopyxis lamellibrachiae TaxID=680125 RepID=A0A3D9FHP6_9SPHN|nr:sodium-dependent transporter [Parasphingopyxis lamellibrachiae]RED16621.1 NSS family neurotransmitter:Na+ symporter [Parasphingopyxis lamellibrachiae]